MGLWFLSSARKRVKCMGDGGWGDGFTGPAALLGQGHPLPRCLKCINKSLLVYIEQFTVPFPIASCYFHGFREKHCKTNILEFPEETLNPVKNK